MRAYPNEVGYHYAATATKSNDWLRASIESTAEPTT